MTHQATVTVVNGQVQVNDSKLKPKDKPATLIWTMGTAGYQFTTIGIAFTNNTGQFTSPTRAADGLTFTWQDANTDLLTYNYNIAVQVGSQPHGILRLDPAVENGTLNP